MDEEGSTLPESWLKQSRVQPIVYGLAPIDHQRDLRDRGLIERVTSFEHGVGSKAAWYCIRCASKLPTHL